MSKPLLSIRVDVRIPGRAPEAWGVEVNSEGKYTPTQLASRIDTAFRDIRAKVEELLK